MSLYAMLGAERRRATPDGPRRAQCPDCSAEMLAKTGSVVVWHWAHRVRPLDCQAAHEGEWHLAWKALALDGTQEVAHPSGKRRADVLAPGGFAVEFQASPLTAAEVQAREADWDNKLVWVFDAREAFQKGSLKVLGEGTQRGIFWFKAPERIKAARCPTYYDLGDGNLIQVGELRREKASLKGRGWFVSQTSVVSGVLRGVTLPHIPHREVVAATQNLTLDTVDVRVRDFLVHSVRGSSVFLNVAGTDHGLDDILDTVGWRPDWLSPPSWLLPAWSDHVLCAELQRASMRVLSCNFDFTLIRYPKFCCLHSFTENGYLYLARKVAHNPYLTLPDWMPWSSANEGATS